MPAPGPGGSWIDDFESNKLDSKWVATRFSIGGQNDGVWTRNISNSKLYAHGVSFGTETSYWGEVFTLPLNAPGDIIVEALVRQKVILGSTSRLSVGFVSPGILGADMYTAGGFNVKCGRSNVGGQTPFPGLPSMNEQYANVDQISLYRIVRKNGYMFIYIDGLFIGQYAYAPTITAAYISYLWYQNNPGIDKWIDYISVWPREVVL